MNRVRASSFEIIRDSQDLSGEKRQPKLFGYIGIDADNRKAFESLKALCSEETVDKIVIVYHDYAFSLIGVSLSESNVNPPSVRLEGKYKFSANDIQLERLAEY